MRRPAKRSRASKVRRRTPQPGRRSASVSSWKIRIQELNNGPIVVVPVRKIDRKSGRRDALVITAYGKQWEYLRLLGTFTAIGTVRKIAAYMRSIRPLYSSLFRWEFLIVGYVQPPGLKHKRYYAIYHRLLWRKKPKGPWKLGRPLPPE